MKKLKPYPSDICGECGKKYGKQPEPWEVATFHAGACEVCEKKTFITDPRDYGYPDFPGHEQQERMTLTEALIAGGFNI